MQFVAGSHGFICSLWQTAMEMKYNNPRQQYVIACAMHAHRHPGQALEQWRKK